MGVVPGTETPDTVDASYLDLSREGRGNGGFYLLGLLVIILFWIIGGSLLTSGLSVALGGSADGTAAMSDWRRLIVDLLPFALLIAGVLVAVRFVLGRRARTVVTGRRHVSATRILFGGAVFAALLVPAVALDAVVHPGAYHFTFDLQRFVPVLIVALALIPLQSAAEELLFRGYVVQWTSLGTDRTGGRSLRGIGRVAVLAVVSGLVFAIPHLLNPEAAGVQGYAWLAWFFLGAGWAWASVLDGRIELAIGAHIANNLVGVLLVGYSVSVIPTASVWTTAVIDWPVGITTNAVLAVLFVLITCRGLRPRSGMN